MDMDLDHIDAFVYILRSRKDIWPETKKKKVIAGALAGALARPSFVILTP